MSNRKSMVQIAQDLGVTRQTIYNRLKSKELAEAVKPFTIVEGCNKFYDIQAQELIKQAVLKDSLKVSKENFDNIVEELEASKAKFDVVLKQLEASKKDLDKAKQTISELQSDNLALQTETQNLKAVKMNLDNRISELQNKIATADVEHKLLIQKLNHSNEINALNQKRLDEQTEQFKNLETDKAKLNERLDKAETNISNLTTALTAAQALHGMDKQQAAIEVKAEPTQELQSEPEQPKQSFFKRLFGKKN